MKLGSWVAIVGVVLGGAAVLAADTMPAATAASAPAAGPVVSKPVEKDGLQMTVSLPKASFTESEGVRFTVTYKNTSKEAFVLEDADWLWNQTVQFEDLSHLPGPWVPKLDIMIKRSPTVHTLKPGETFEFTVDFATEKKPLHFEWAGIQKKPVEPVPKLNPGKYRLTIGLTMLGGEGKDGVKPWAGKIASEPVEFEITKTAAVKFDTHDGYFVSNKFEPDAKASYVVLHDQKGFDEVFGVAMVMGDKSHRLAKDAFDTKLVVAAIKRDSSVWTFGVKSATVSGGVLTIDYTAKDSGVDQSSAAFACPVIISVPKGEYTIVEFVENGKSVKKIEMKK